MDNKIPEKNIDADNMKGIEKGDLVKIELTGRLLDGSVFETTDESVAKSAEVWSNRAKYGPRLVIVGRGAMIAGLEEEIPLMRAGEKKSVRISVDKAFGPKHASLVRVMPMKEFEKHGVRAIPGLMITLDGVPALVKSVSSGRVMLDFNHPLAGQELTYEVHLLEIVNEPEKKAKELATQFGASIRIEPSGNGRKIIIEKGTESSKTKGLEASLKACLGDWATISSD